jgi:hypothetical protein
MKWKLGDGLKRVLAFSAIALVLWGQVHAQNLGTAPASNVAVQGEQATQPEGAFLNFINWVSNVIAPWLAPSSRGLTGEE